MATRDIYIQITRDCIHDCIFCSAPKKEVYLSLEEIKKRIDKYKKLNYTDINISGGEPTLHPDLIEIVKYGVKKGFKVRMTSNGVNLADPSLMKALVKAGLERILFSIHHYDPEKAKIINGVDEADLDKTLKGVENADKLNIDININITVIKQNYQALPGIISMLIPRFKNIRHFNFNFVDISGNIIKKGTKYGPEDVAPRYSDAEKYLVKAFKILKKNNILFRFERAPLCYAPGFEAYNSNANRAVGAEFHATTFTDKKDPDLNDNDIPMVKSEYCKFCNLNDICFGVEPNYNEIYGTDELYPVFINPNMVEFEIKNQNPHAEIISIIKSKKPSSDVFEKLSNKFGGINALIRQKEKFILNPLFTYKKEGFHLIDRELLESFLLYLRKESYNLKKFKILAPNANLSFLQNIKKEYGIELIRPETFGFATVYDPRIISSIRLSKELINTYGIINFLELNLKSDTSFSCLLSFVSQKLRKKLITLPKEKYNNALLDIYSVVKHKIKANIGIFKTDASYLSLSKELSTLDYFLEKTTSDYKSILDLVSMRKLGPKDEKDVEIIYL